MGAVREGRKIVISGDTAPCEAIAIASHEADVLVHEATFAEEEAGRASQTGHSTARQAAALARDAQVRLLALTHVSSRYAGGELREQARELFANTESPRDFDSIEIPFAEKGPAELVRFSRRAVSEQGVSAEQSAGAEQGVSAEPAAHGDESVAHGDAATGETDPANSKESAQPDAQAVAPR
jgi:ribonuclease Z